MARPPGVGRGDGGGLHQRPHAEWRGTACSKRVGGHGGILYRRDRRGASGVWKEELLMGPLEITGTARLALGLVTGIAFGFILQKGQALEFHKNSDGLRLRDFTIWKLM